MAKHTGDVFTLKRFGLLFVVAVAITIALYYIDSDPPSDTLAQRVFNTLFMFGIITVIYTLANLRKLKS